MFSSLIDIVEVFSKKEIKIHFKNGLKLGKKKE
jgi:hypothetical protein